MVRLTSAHLDELRALHDETAAAVAWLVDGAHLGATGAQLRAAVADVLARGRIRNDREYHLLRDHLDAVEPGPAPAEEARAIAGLLDAYRASA